MTGRLQRKEQIIVSIVSIKRNHNLGKSGVKIVNQLFLNLGGLIEKVGEGDGTHSSTLAWKIPWTEEPGGLQSTGLLRVERD